MMQLDMKKAYDMVEWGALEHIMRELSLPNQFVDWIMTVVKAMTYRFNVNSVHTPVMVANRGIRQWDPMYPLLFVLVMEYLTGYLQTLETVHGFNFHSRCERLKISSLSFVDDLLLFAQGHRKSI